jgi:hypothetical protein
MNTTPGYYNRMRSLTNAFLIALALVTCARPAAHSQTKNVRMMVSKKIRIPQTIDSLSFAKDSVYQVLDQVKTGAQAGTDKLLLINHQNKTYAVSLINFKAGDTVTAPDINPVPPAREDENVDVTDLNEKLETQKILNEELTSKLTIFEIAAALLTLLVIIGCVFFFKLSDELKKIKRNISLISWDAGFRDIRRFSKIFGIKTEILELLNPNAELRNLKPGDELALIETQQPESTSRINVEHAFERALLKTGPILAEAIQKELSNGSSIGKSKISESQYYELVKTRDALIAHKKDAEAESNLLKIEIVDLRKKIQTDNIDKQMLAKLQGEFTDIRNNNTLLSFAAHANKLLHTLRDVREKVLEFTESRPIKDNQLIFNLISSVFMKYQNSYQQTRVDNWSAVISEMNESGRIYTHAFLRTYKLEVNKDGHHADEFMRVVRKELFREYLSQSLILCETLANLSSFEGVSRDVTGTLEDTFRAFIKILIAEASQAGLKIQYIALGTPDKEVERILGDNWEKISIPEWPFTQTTIGRNRVVQILTLGYQDTPGIPDSKTKIVMDV